MTSVSLGTVYWLILNVSQMIGASTYLKNDPMLSQLINGDQSD